MTAKRQFDSALIERLKQASAVIAGEEAESDTPGNLIRSTGISIPPCADPPEDSNIDERWYLDHQQAFARIVQCLSDQYGHGDIADLGDQILVSLVQEAHDLIDQWETDEPVEGWPHETELQRLLQAHNELGADIVIFEEEADLDDEADEA